MVLETWFSLDVKNNKSANDKLLPGLGQYKIT